MFAGKLTREEQLRLEVMDHFFKQEKKNARLVCRRYGIHHSTFYRWRKRFNPKNLISLKSKKRGPKAGKTIPWSVVIDICTWKRENPGKGAEYLYQEFLSRKETPPCSARTIYRWWKKRNLVKPKSRRKRRNLPLIIKTSSPGELIQIDTKHLPSGKYQYTAIDVFSRLRCIRAYDKATMQSSINFICYVLKYFSFTVKLIQTDNGPEFQKEFVKHLEGIGLAHQYIWIHTPDQNGCVERSHRTDQDEFYNLIDLNSLSLNELNREILLWNQKYNQKRLHWALNWKTPEQFLKLYLSQN